MKTKLFNILMLTFLIGCSRVEERVPLDSPAFSFVITTLEGGKWKWEGDNCEENLQTFRFDINKGSVDLIILDPVGFEDDVPTSYTYEFLWAWKSGFRGRILGESRLDKNGKPIQWDLIIKNNSTFYWRRNDWSKRTGTKSNIKCTQVD